MICLHQTAARQFRLPQLCGAAAAQSCRACWGSLRRWGKNKSQWWRFKLREKKWDKITQVVNSEAFFLHRMLFEHGLLCVLTFKSWVKEVPTFGPLRYHHHFRLKTFWLLSTHPSFWAMLAHTDTDKQLWGQTHTLVYNLEQLLPLPNKKNFQFHSRLSSVFVHKNKALDILIIIGRCSVPSWTYFLTRSE